MQAEVNRLEGLVDAEAGRADFHPGQAAEDNVDSFVESLHQHDSLDLNPTLYSAG